MNRQEILEALKNDNYYRNLSDKDFFDANNLDNLAKYLEHNFAKTDESKKVILDMLSHKKHNPSDLYDYRITQEELFNLNKKYYDNTYLYHGLNAYTTNLTDKSLDISEKIENNLYNIINNKDIELATSSTHMIGDIGIKGKGDSLFAQPWDMYSIVDKETGKRSKPRERAIITEDDIFGIIEKYHENPKSIRPWEKHDEVIAKNFEIESLWVKENFYNNNQDFVLKLLKDNKIQNLDIIHSNSFEQYRDIDIERVNVNNINLKENNIKNLVNQPSIIGPKKPIHETKSISDASTITKDKKIIYNNLQSLNDIERKAIDIYENGTMQEFFDFFVENLVDEYDSFKDLLTKAKGYTKIENKVFSDALDEAFKQSPIYDAATYRKYRKSKEIADKYFAHLGRTKESQNMILDYIANNIDIDSDKLLKANAKYFEEQSVNHGLYAFPDDIYTVKGHTNNPLERIDDNINDIIKNKQMEMSLTSSEYMIGPIGVTGKTTPIAYHTNDIRSHLEFSFDGGKRVYQQNNKRGTGTVQDIVDSLKEESTVDLFSGHDELIGKSLDIESLWVKEDFYTQNKDYVYELMQKYNINNLDLIHASENTEKIIPSQIERINVFSKANVEDKKLTPQEAFDKYGPNDDKFYTSQGLDPKKQKEVINKLNSKRKPPEPLPDYSADDARLDKMFAEDKVYIESLEKQRKRPNYKPVKGPKLKKKNNNIIDKIFEFEDKYENNINFNNENIKQEFEKLSKGHGKLYSELLYRPKEYRQELSKYYEALKSDIRPFHEIPKIIGNDIEPIMSVQNIFAQEHGFESYNDMLKYTSEHFDGKSPIPIKKISELKNNVKTEISEPKPKETVKEPKVEETVKQDKNLEKATNEVQDNFTENINNTPKPKVENTTKPSKNIVKPTKNTSKMTTKSLGVAGKGAIGLIVAGITGLAIGKALSSDEKD